MDFSKSISVINILVAAVISFVIVAALFPVIDDSAGQLQAAAQNSTNTLIVKLAPVLPYIIGIALFTVILFPITWLLGQLRGGG